MNKPANENWCDVCDNPKQCCTCPKTNEIKK